MMKCDICDRPIGPRCGMRIDHNPNRMLSFDLSSPSPFVSMRVWEVTTCGSEVCMFRARHHGVPGLNYGVPS